MVSVIFRTSLAITALPYAVAMKVLQKYTVVTLVPVTNHTEAQEEAPKCVLGIFHFLRLSRHTLLPLCHLANLSYKVHKKSASFPA